MKLSQIKKIIKESIKGLMNEQTVSGYKRVEGIICNHPIPAVIGTLTNFEVGAAMGGLVYCNGVPCTPSNVGETLGLGKIDLPDAKRQHRQDHRHYSFVLNAESRAKIEQSCKRELEPMDYRWEFQQ